MAWRPLARRALAPAAFAFLGLVWSPSLFAKDTVDWERHGDVGTVTVVTTTEEGELRETTVWLAVVEGQGYLRTGSTRWGRDVERSPKLGLRIGEESLALRAEFVEDDALRERVSAAFREKYGWKDALVGIFRGGRPKIMKLLPRSASEDGREGVRLRRGARVRPAVGAA